MILRNPFPPEVRLLFLYSYECWECGRNGNTSGGMELHHIYGRISSSALNAAPLCRECHAGVLHLQDEHRRLMRKTMQFLLANQYKLSPTDELFLLAVQNDLQDFKI